MECVGGGKCLKEETIQTQNLERNECLTLNPMLKTLNNGGSGDGGYCMGFIHPFNLTIHCSLIYISKEGGG
ncbi:hypothetical protein MHBO_004775 [Bonamia ostreae]|uniref:Uncharacterized protein n=1 Tax=Bonamia ostreae TaxID=126728 RepID=A0ABV2AU94_9EUKA